MMKGLQRWTILAFVLMIASELDAWAAQLFFTPRAAVRESYNDNLDLDRKNKQDDFITSVSLGGTLQLRGELGDLQISYDPSYSFYSDYDEYDSWRHAVRGSGSYNFSQQTRFTFLNDFLYAKDPLDARDVEDDEGNIVQEGDDRRRRQDTYWRNTAFTSLRHRFGIEDSVLFKMEHGLWKYEDQTREDRQKINPSAALYYWFSKFTGMEIGFDYTRGLYDDQEYSTREGGSDFSNYRGRIRLNQRIERQFGVYAEYAHILRDFDEGAEDSDGGTDYMVYAPSAGVFYQFDPTLRATLGGGWFYQQRENDKDEDGPFLGGQINKLWDFKTWSVRTRASSGLGSQDFSSDPQGFERYAMGELIGRYDFTRELFGDWYLRTRYSDYLNSEDDEADVRYTAEAGIGYRITRWMTLRLGYQFNKLDAINSKEDYEQHRVSGTVTLQPDIPWRLWY